MINYAGSASPGLFFVDPSRNTHTSDPDGAITGARFNVALAAPYSLHLVPLSVSCTLYLVPSGDGVLQHNLLTFKIDEEDGISTFLFEGADHSQGGAANGTI